MKDNMVSGLREQGKAVLVMLSIAVVSVLAMIALDFFRQSAQTMTGLGNGTINASVQATLLLFITAFGITGSFASVTMLIIVVKAVISVVRGLKS